MIQSKGKRYGRSPLSETTRDLRLDFNQVPSQDMAGYVQVLYIMNILADLIVFCATDLLHLAFAHPSSRNHHSPA